MNVLTVDLKVVEHAHPPENQATESDWERSSVSAGYSKNTQHTGHGKRETDVRGKRNLIRYVDQVSCQTRGEQSA